MYHGPASSTQPSRPFGTKDLHTLYLAGGCFWGLEAFLKQLPGVHNTEVGYANGKTDSPTYEDVCCRGSGHAETVAVTYDRTALPTESLLEGFFSAIDPTTSNRQGNDCGTQYRSGIYYLDKSDLPLIEAAVSHEQDNHPLPIVTEIKPLENFFSAETYHQDYLDKNPSGYCHIDPGAAEAFIERKGLRAENSREGTDRSEQGLPPDHDDAISGREIDELIVEKGYIAPTDAELRDMLSDEQYRVTRQNATEFPYANEHCDNFEKGLYVDVTSGEPLFTSMDKFESGCGWPSFARPITDEVVTEHEDRTLFTTRTEVRSRAGNAHLGHVFPDGPAETGGLRYCINSAALRFIPYCDLEAEGYGYLKPLFDKQGAYPRSA